MSTSRCKSCGNPTDKMSNDFINKRMSGDQLTSKYTITETIFDFDKNTTKTITKPPRICCIISVTTLTFVPDIMLPAIPKPIYNGTN